MPEFSPTRLPTKLLLAAVVCFGTTLGAAAQPSTEVPQPQGGHPTFGEALEPGANSFTEAQVMARLAEIGFTDVKDLKKDDQGIWHARATHAGKEVGIGLDYKGHVAAR